MSEVLRAPYVLEYTYRRSLGPIVGTFLAGLKDRKLLGARTSDGRVIFPPTEYDPASGDALSEIAEVGAEGVVVTWAWMAEPRPRQPLARPFAWALVRLDGATTSMLHAVDAPRDAMRTGMRVRVRWRADRTGSINDIECFEAVT